MKSRGENKPLDKLVENCIKPDDIEYAVFVSATSL